jgi:hypothetical protein
MTPKHATSLLRHMAHLAFAPADLLTVVVNSLQTHYTALSTSKVRSHDYETLKAAMYAVHQLKCRDEPLLTAMCDWLCKVIDEYTKGCVFNTPHWFCGVNSKIFVNVFISATSQPSLQSQHNIHKNQY